MEILNSADASLEGKEIKKIKVKTYNLRKNVKFIWMKTAHENIKFMVMVLLKWGFYLALSPNYLELRIMLKIC